MENYAFKKNRQTIYEGIFPDKKNYWVNCFLIEDGVHESTFRNSDINIRELSNI